MNSRAVGSLIPPPRKYLGGSLNRIIRLVSREREVRAAVEDDFHHFRVALRHDGRRVTDVTSDTLRAPYTLCSAAGARLDELRGEEITTDLTKLTRHVDARSQCTHQFDLACIAVAMAARGEGVRHYHAIVEDSTTDHFRATLDRDGARVLEWQMKGDDILSPDPYSGRTINSGFTGFVSQYLEGESAEAALVLRRTVFIASGRGLDYWVDKLPHAIATGGCWVQQEERHQQASRNKGTTRDFTGLTDRLTAEDDNWLGW